MKCLVEEARKKCKCYWCNQCRGMAQVAIQSYVQFQRIKIIGEALEERK